MKIYISGKITNNKDYKQQFKNAVYSKIKAYKTSTKTPEEIQKIKEKYKYGIPDGEIERWILEKE